MVKLSPVKKDITLGLSWYQRGLLPFVSFTSISPAGGRQCLLLLKTSNRVNKITYEAWCDFVYTDSTLPFLKIADDLDTNYFSKDFLIVLMNVDMSYNTPCATE